MRPRRSVTSLLCLAWIALLTWAVRAGPIDDYIQAEMDKGHLPGVALAIVQGGAVVKIAGYGLANVEDAVPVTARTVFQIQSITKSFVATAILMLAEDGKLSLDDPISAHLEETPQTWCPITLRHLLTHTSGIKDFINEPTASLRLEVTEADIFKATTARPLNFIPGEKYAYSNSNYHLLAMIIRKLTGKSYGEFLRDRIFEPLEMTRTRVLSSSAIVPHRAAGYLWRNDELRHGQFVAESILAYGGGGLLSTVEDMAKFAQALRGEKLLKQASLDAMWSPPQLAGGKPSRYALGWAVGGQPPHRYVHHSGGHVTGFTSHIVHYLEDDLSIIILTNAGHGAPEKMAQTIARLHLPVLAPAEPDRSSN